MKLAKSFSIYALVGFFGAGVSFLLLPILTKYLTPGDYGKLSLFNTYIAILVPILGLSSTSILSVDYFNLNRKNFNDLFKSASVAPFFGACVAFVTVYFWNSFFSELLEISGNWLYAIVIICYCVIHSNVLQALLINKKKSKAYSIVYLGKVLLEIFLTLVFVVVLEMDWRGRVASWMLVSLLIAVVAIIYFYKSGYFGGKIDYSKIRNALRFGIPLIPHELGKFAINQSDRIFLAKMVSIGETGIYSVGYLIGSIVLILSSAALKVYSPFLFERLGNIDEVKKIEIIRLSYLLVLGLAAVTVLVNILAPFLFEFVLDKNYLDAGKYVFWISLSYFFWGVYLVFTGYVFHLKKTRILSQLAILNVLLNLIGNYWLINEFGAIGAAYATALSFFVIMCLMIIISNRVFPMPWLNFKLIMHFK